MLTCVLIALGCVVLLAVASALALLGFRYGDFSGESLARALLPDLEAAARDAARDDGVPPR